MNTVPHAEAPDGPKQLPRNATNQNLNRLPTLITAEQYIAATSEQRGVMREVQRVERSGLNDLRMFQRLHGIDVGNRPRQRGKNNYRPGKNGGPKRPTAAMRAQLQQQELTKKMYDYICRLEGSAQTNSSEAVNPSTINTNAFSDSM